MTRFISKYQQVSGPIIESPKGVGLLTPVGFRQDGLYGHSSPLHCGTGGRSCRVGLVLVGVYSCFLHTGYQPPGECCRQYWLMRSGVGDKEASVLSIKLFLEEFPLRFGSLLVSPQDGSQS